MATIRSEIQQKAQGAIIQYAIFRWETAAVIALTILLFFFVRRPFFWWPPFGWPLLGLLAVLAIIYSSMTDADTNARVVLDLFQQQFDPRGLRDKELRENVASALEYQRRIEMQIRSQQSAPIRERLEGTANQITDWISNIHQLALRLDIYRRDDLLDRERAALPNEIVRIREQLKQESNPQVRQQFASVLAGKEKHWQTLRELDARMSQAALQLEQSLTALATIYSQVQLVDAQSVNSGRAERLQADIQEQVARLNDLVASINEVYNFTTEGVG